jgi:hypothetical protein
LYRKIEEQNCTINNVEKCEYFHCWPNMPTKDWH